MASLRDLGLSEYEARAYRALLRDSPATAKELSRSSDVPMGRIYDVLNNLEQRGLVRSQAASRPKKYVGVEPEAALSKLLDAKRGELREKERQYEETVTDLEGELDAADPVDEQFWTAAVGSEETVDLLLERLGTANDRIVTVAGGPALQFDLGKYSDPVIEALEGAVDRGATVSVLLHPDVIRSLPETTLERYERTLAERPTFEVRTSEQVSGSFHLIDGVEACIEVPNPIDPTEPFAMIDLKDAEFVSGIRDLFDPRWEDADAVPLEA